MISAKKKSSKQMVFDICCVLFYAFAMFFLFFLSFDRLLALKIILEFALEKVLVSLNLKPAQYQQ